MGKNRLGQGQIGYRIAILARLEVQQALQIVWSGMPGRQFQQSACVGLRGLVVAQLQEQQTAFKQITIISLSYVDGLLVGGQGPFEILSLCEDIPTETPGAALIGVVRNYLVKYRGSAGKVLATCKQSGPGQQCLDRIG